MSKSHCKTIHNVWYYMFKIMLEVLVSGIMVLWTSPFQIDLSIYLFYFTYVFSLFWVFIEACRLCFVAWGFSTWDIWASIVVAHGFSCLLECGIFIPQPGIDPTPPVLEGRFFTIEPLEKSLEHLLSIKYRNRSLQNYSLVMAKRLE